MLDESHSVNFLYSSAKTTPTPAVQLLSRTSPPRETNPLTAPMPSTLSTMQSVSGSPAPDEAIPAREDDDDKDFVLPEYNGEPLEHVFKDETGLGEGEGESEVVPTDAAPAAQGSAVKADGKHGDDDFDMFSDNFSSRMVDQAGPATRKENADLSGNWDDHEGYYRE